MFTDSYGEQSCTAGRSSFITGQSVYRTGPVQGGHSRRAGRHDRESVTIAALLKNQGYATGQFGKNHLGDLNHMLPDQSRFRRVLRQSLSPERRRRAGDVRLSVREGFPEFPQEIRPTRRYALPGPPTRTIPREERWGKVGKQKIEDTGPLTTKRMETCDDEFAAAAKGFIKRQNDAGKPFFVWLNFTHMHLYTHTKPESLGQAGRWQSPYHDTMIDHDKNVGEMLDYLDKLGIADNTFVMYSTDNGPHRNSWPDGGTTPFRSEKDTNWEGAFRIPMLVRWPGHIKAGSVSNDIVQHHDWFPTFLAAGGRTGRHGETEERVTRRSAAPTRTISTATTCCPI